MKGLFLMLNSNLSLTASPLPYLGLEAHVKSQLGSVNARAFFAPEMPVLFIEMCKFLEQ